MEASIGVVIGCSMMAWMDPPIAEAAASLLQKLQHLGCERCEPLLDVRSVFILCMFLKKECWLNQMIDN